MAGYIGSKASVTQVDGYTRTEADAEFVNDPNDVITVSGSKVGIGTSSPFSTLSTSVGHNAPSTSGNMASHGATIHNGQGGRAVQIGVNETGAYNYIQSSYVNNANVGVELAFFTGASERMRIDSAGRVTMPYQPSFKVAANYSSAPYIDGATLLYVYEEYDVGNNFANNRFTAPVAGVYHFDVSVFVRTVSAGYGYSYIALTKNGNITAPYAHTDYNNITNYHMLSMSRTMQLAANDYVQVYAFNDPSHRVYNSSSYNHFSGHLIG